MCIAWASPCLSVHHPASQLMSIPLHQLFARTLLIFQKWFSLVFVILLCIGKKKKKMKSSGKEIKKEKQKNGKRGAREREENKR